MHRHLDRRNSGCLLCSQTFPPPPEECKHLRLHCEITKLGSCIITLRPRVTSRDKALPTLLDVLLANRGCRSALQLRFARFLDEVSDQLRSRIFVEVHSDESTRLYRAR